MGSFYTESSYNFGTNSAQFPADRERCQGETAERYKGKAASGTRERTRAIQGKGRGAVPGRGRERYKGKGAERYQEEDASDTRERTRAVQRRGRERYKGETASDTKERTRAVQRRGRERYKENKEDVTAGDRKDDSVSPTVPSPHSFTDSLRKVSSEDSSSEDSLVCGKFRQI